MTTTWDYIAGTVLTSTVSTIDFTSISQSYTDLVMLCSVRGTASGHLRFRVGNGTFDTGTNYNVIGLWARDNLGAKESGSNMTVTETQGAIGNWTYVVPDNANEFGTSFTHFMNYSSTYNLKNMLTRSNSMGSDRYWGVEGATQTWINTSAINQIRIYAHNGDLVAGTMVSIYGITRE